MKYKAVDTETFLIGPGQIAPKMVCLVYSDLLDDQQPSEPVVLGNSPEDRAAAHIQQWLEDQDLTLVFANAAFDLTVLATSYPRLLPLIFQALEDGRIEDVQIREKLIDLSTHGQLSKMRLPDGSTKQLEYSLAALAMRYLGIDRSEEKNSLDSWRLNYFQLDGLRASEYPDEALQYAKDDALQTLLIFLAQQDRVDNGDGSIKTSAFQSAADFALRLMTCWGFEIDQAEVAKVEAVVQAALAPEKLSLLFESGILRRAVPPAPYVKQVDKAKEILLHSGKVKPTLGDAEWSAAFVEHREFLEGLGIKFKAGVDSSRNLEVLKRYICDLCLEYGIPIKLTDAGQTSSGLSSVPPEKDHEAFRFALDYAAADGDFLAQVVARTNDPTLTQYQDRMEMDKLISTYLPLLRGNSVIYPNYSVLVETGRTASYGGGRNSKKPLYPACNIQQQPKDIGGASVRHCFVPRAGRVLWDVDYQALELACVGQITKDLFGASLHFDLYNAGVDLHAYLGAQLALRIGKDRPSQVFRDVCKAEGIIETPQEVYKAFLRCKKADQEELRGFFKHYRTFAKPVGLGFPGGLGAATMVSFARTTYEVVITEDQAREFKQIWLGTYPEMSHYFRWVEAQIDERNQYLAALPEGEEGDRQQALWYTSPMGMVRRGTTYCGVANGCAMQTPGAELAKTAAFLVSRACYDETQESVLYGCRPIAFVHDQIIGETTEDQDLWHEQCMEVSRLMVEAAKIVLPGISMRTEPLLTTVWSKRAVQIFDENKRLLPWIPE